MVYSFGLNLSAGRYGRPGRGNGILINQRIRVVRKATVSEEFDDPTISMYDPVP